MQIRTTTAAVAALVVSAAMTLSAQAPQAPETAQKTAAAEPAITISGCLKQEKDVPGLKPSIAERAGVTDDYVVTNVKMAAGSPVSGIGLAAKYEVEGIAEAELKKHLDHQVELTGRVAQSTAGATDDAPDFQATTIKMLAATCSAQ